MVLGMEPIDVVQTDDSFDAEMDAEMNIEVVVDTGEAGLEVVPRYCYPVVYSSWYWYQHQYLGYLDCYS